MDTLLQDLRYAARSLRTQRGTTAVALLCLALAIGANTAIFSVVRAVLFDSLPYRDASRLAQLYEVAFVNGVRGLSSFSVPSYLDVKAQNAAFESVAATSGGSADVAGDGAEPERIKRLKATAELFDVLGAKALLGRTFSPGEDQAGHDVVVISEGFWRRRFAADPGVVGRKILLNNVPYSVVGVMPAHFDYPISPIHTDAWVPFVFTPENLRGRGAHFIQVVARFKPGIDSVSANANLDPIGRRIAAEYPNEQKGRLFQAVPLTTVVTAKARPALLLLFGAAGLVLLIACANVANLLLARATSRAREIGIRTALGAERSRLIRQLLTESFMLSFMGALCGLLVARWALKAILAYATSALPRADAVHMDGGVLLFALAVALATGLGFGVVPAFRASDIDVRAALREAAGRGATSRRQYRTLNTFIVGQIAVSLSLLVGAGLVIRAFMALIETDPGFKPDHLLTFHVSAPAGHYADSMKFLSFFGPLTDRLRAIPGVRNVSMTTMLPIQDSGINGVFNIVGQPVESDPARRPFAEFRVVGGDFFRTMGIPLVRGRGFTADDAWGRQPVVVVNEVFAKRYFTGDVIGKQITQWSGKPATIIGVVGAIHQMTLEREPAPEIYVPGAQLPRELGNVTFIVSTRQDPSSIVPTVRQAIRDVASNQPVFQIETMDDVISDSLRARKLTLSLLGIFALLATALSAAGVYGVTSYAVTQRTREIGIRMALGARSIDVATMVLRGAGGVALLGVAIGGAVTLLTTRILEGMMFGSIGVRDPLTFGGVSILLLTVAILASLVPALRAARADPLVAMRTD